MYMCFQVLVGGHDCHPGLLSVDSHIYFITVADRRQGDLEASKEQLQAELTTTKRVSRAKDQQILDLKEELWAREEKLMLKQKSKWNRAGVDVVYRRGLTQVI